jgi:hypothetical protein
MNLAAAPKRPVKILSAISWRSLRSLRLKAFLPPEQITDGLFHHRAADLGK